MKINNAEILCVGTEILIGDIVNTNAAYISKRLTELGIDQYHQSVVGDNPTRLKQFLGKALERADLVIMTGGLGPTYDDLTKETAAELMNKKLVLHEPSLDRIKSYFSALNRTMTKNNEKQAYMPEGCIVFENNCGTAPGCAIEDNEKNKSIILLPGPPREMKAMFEESVFPYLMKDSEYRFISHDVNLFGIGESSAEDAVKDILVNSKNPTVAPYAKDGEVRLRVTAKAKTNEEAESLCVCMIEKLYQTPIGKYIYGLDTTLAEVLVKKLTENNMKIAVAESCTGGGVTQKITAIPGASSILDGSIVSYANKIKHKLLNVSDETLEKHGAVSSECALEMARGVRALMQSDIGISVTGIAGPVGGTKEKPVGTVYIAVSTQKDERAERLSIRDNGREYIRNIAALNALSLALKSI